MLTNNTNNNRNDVLGQQRKAEEDRHPSLEEEPTDGYPRGEVFHRGDHRQARPVETSASVAAEPSGAEQERKRQWQVKLVTAAARQVEAMGMEGIEVLRPEAAREALEVMTASFGGSEKTQPVFDLEWLLGSKLRGKFDDPLRIAHMGAMMEALWGATMYCGGIAVGARSATTGKIDGVMLAYPQIGENGERGPDFGSVPNSGIFGPPPAGFTPSPPLPPINEWHARRVAFAYSETGFSVFRELHHNFATGPHWYGSVLAVNPNLQRSGVGKKLMRVLFGLSEKSNVPLYIETCGERNRKIYERMNFVACGTGFEWNLPGDPDEPLLDPQTNSIVRQYGLIRQPRKSAL